MKTIKVRSWEITEASSYVTDVKQLGFDVTEEMLQCFPRYIDEKLSEEEVEELLHSGFWDTREIKNLKLTPFFNQTVRRQDVKVEFDVEAIVELPDAPDTKFIFEFSVDRYCEGSYGEDRQQILEILEKEKDKFVNGELVSETKAQLNGLIFVITDILVRSELRVDYSELNSFKKTVFEKLRSWEYDMTSADLDSLFSDCNIYDRVDQRTMKKIESLFIDFEVEVVEKWKDRINFFTDI